MSSYNSSGSIQNCMSLGMMNLHPFKECCKSSCCLKAHLFFIDLESRKRQVLFIQRMTFA